ncbi:hypothetical protein AD939_00250 [Gluconobacter oxydans]|nr:hypothetical protein [Gluconobacter oxydans]KXV36460.1 hypothetical protein AD939_00250 [Gluconobacter oxydans]
MSGPCFSSHGKAALGSIWPMLPPCFEACDLIIQTEIYRCLVMMLNHGNAFYGRWGISLSPTVIECTCVEFRVCTGNYLTVHRMPGFINIKHHLDLACGIFPDQFFRIHRFVFHNLRRIGFRFLGV